VSLHFAVTCADASSPALLHAGRTRHAACWLRRWHRPWRRVATLAWVHRDPFDRMLVAQAKEEGLTLLSADAALKGYGRFVCVV
jgi:hypothetical protein